MNEPTRKLPRGYISYSAYKLWRTSREAYRKRYYEDERPFETVETRFGKQIADWLESGDPRTRHIPNYLNREYDIEVEIEGTVVRGRIDGFDPERVRFLDHKSSHRDKKGRVPWDRVKVRQLDQLPFYSMLLMERFGKVDNRCHLIWIETEFAAETVTFAGHELRSPGSELRMTGFVRKFPRVIRQFERDRIREDLLKAIKEIEADYEAHKKGKGEDVQVDG